jgi:putative ATP-binding cassette transporter
MTPKPFLSTPKQTSLLSYPRFYRDVLKRAFLYWKGSERTSAWLLLVSSVIFVGCFVGTSFLINQWMKNFYDALQAYDAKAFGRLIRIFCGLAFVYIMVQVVKSYLVGLLTLRWRRFMTRHYIQLWLSDRLYYWLQIRGQGADNPDQRLAQDLNIMTGQTLTLFFKFFESLIMLSVFSGVLWGLSDPLSFELWGVHINLPGSLFFLALAYAGIGTWMTKKAVAPLLALDFQMETYEGNFRYSLVRVRENAESIAFYQGEETEAETFGDLFKNIYTNGHTILLRLLGINTLTSWYGQAAIIVPFIAMAPRFFREKLLMGILMQVAGAFGKVENSLSVIIENYPQIISWKASTLRVLTFEKCMKELQTLNNQSKLVRKTHTQTPLILENLTLTTPEGSLIAHIPNRTLHQGEWTLLQGPSGMGKSTLLRTLSGVWPFAEGTLYFPKDSTLFFVPQKPYLPVGSLAQALTYPLSAGTFGKDELASLLRDVGLAKLIPCLDQREPWAQILSGGEQQRLAFARLLLQNPDWVFLDEATSALDDAAETALYELLKKRCPHMTVLSVGHRPSLQGFHTHTWTWEDRPIEN